MVGWCSMGTLNDPWNQSHPRKKRPQRCCPIPNEKKHGFCWWLDVNGGRDENYRWWVMNLHWYHIKSPWTGASTHKRICFIFHGAKSFSTVPDEDPLVTLPVHGCGAFGLLLSVLVLDPGELKKSMGAGDGKWKTQEITGWWFGTWMDYDFPYIGKFVTPTDFHSIIFQRGRRTNHQPVRLIPGMGTSENRYLGIWMSKFTIHTIWEYLEKSAVIKNGDKQKWRKTPSLRIFMTCHATEKKRRPNIQWSLGVVMNP